MSTRLRIAICSDLHVDTWPEHSLDWATSAAAAPADVLLVAGDVHDEQSGTAAELARAAEHYKAVAWVDGNHEAFHFGRCIRGSSDNCSALHIAPNVTFLGAEGASLRVGGTLFVGACAWWDFQFAAPECDPDACRERFKDVALAEAWFVGNSEDGDFDQAVLKAAHRDYSRLADAIIAAQSDDSVAQIVVATHTVPHRSLLQKGIYPKNLADAAYYGSSLMERIPALDSRRKIALWVFGHSHAGGNLRIGHILYRGHPRGRPDDYGRAIYSPVVITVGDDDAAPATAVESDAAPAVAMT